MSDDDMSEEDEDEDEDNQENQSQHPPLRKKEGILVGGRRHNFGVTRDGFVVNDSPELRFNLYRQEGGQDERFHVTMDVMFKTTHFYDMWVRTKAPAPPRRSKRNRS